LLCWRHGELSFEQPRHMQCFPLRTIVDLVLATGAVGFYNAVVSCENELRWPSRWCEVLYPKAHIGFGTLHRNELEGSVNRLVISNTAAPGSLTGDRRVF
jgi:hypothetical protein